MKLLKNISAAVALCMFTTAPLWAQSEAGFPSRPIKIIVPYAPGATNDALPRLLAPKMTEILKQPVIVENRVGAGGDIGVNVVAKGKPDGYQILMTSNAAGVSAATRRKPAFDVIAELQPIGLIGVQPMILVAATSFPANTIGDFIKMAKAAPEKYSYATPGLGTPHQLTFELLTATHQLKMLHVPFVGTAPGLTETAAERVTLTLATAGSAGAMLASGRVKVIGVAAKTRLAEFPNAPTFIEAGVPTVESGFWYGFNVAAGTPAPITAKLIEAFSAALAHPEVVAGARKMDVQVQNLLGPQFGEYLAADYRKWKKVAEDAKIVID